MRDKNLVEDITAIAKAASELYTEGTGGLVVVWKQSDTRQEDMVAIVSGDSQAAGSEEETKSQFTTSMAIADLMSKNRVFARIILFAVQEYQKIIATHTNVGKSS